jgi:hypothetical protein
MDHRSVDQDKTGQTETEKPSLVMTKAKKRKSAFGSASISDWLWT